MGTGLYLSSFIDQMNRQRVLEEESARRAGYEQSHVFQIDQYLKGLDQENDAKGILAQVLANRQKPPMPPPGMPPLPGAPMPPSAPMAPPGGPPVEPPMGAPAPMAPEISQPELPGAPGGPGPMPGPMPMGPGASALPAPPSAPPMGPSAPPMGPQMPPGAPPMAGGLPEAPMRAGVTDSLLAGLTTEQQAKLLTSRTGQHVLPTLETAEKERRKEEDKRDAESIFKKAQESFNAKDPATWADMMAAGYRRLGDAGQASKFMEYGARVRVDKQETDDAKADFISLNKAVKKYQSDPSPENLSNLHDAMVETKSLTGRALAQEMTRNAVSKALSADPEVNALLTYVTQARVVTRVPETKAWEDAIAKYPNAAAKLWSQALMNPQHATLPQGFYDALRVAPPAPSKDPTIGQRAYMNAMATAQAKGIQPGTNEFNRLWEDERLKLIRAEKDAAEDPTLKKNRELDNQLKQNRLDAQDAAEHPEKYSLDKLTVITQRLSRQFDQADTVEERASLKATLATLNSIIAKKREDLGGKTEGDTIKTARLERIRGTTRKLFPKRDPATLTAEEKKRVIDAVDAATR